MPETSNTDAKVRHCGYLFSGPCGQTPCFAHSIRGCQAVNRQIAGAEPSSDAEARGPCQISGKFIPPRFRDPFSQNAEVYFREAAGLYKQNFETPLILVGGIRSYQVAKSLVEEGLADYVSLSRPLIREPALVNRWKSGDYHKSACLSDNLCLKLVKSGKGLYCVSAKKGDASVSLGDNSTD